MQLLQIETSKITYLTVVRRLQGQLFLPMAVKGLVERYHFGEAPTSIKDLRETPVSFGHGLFKGVAIERFDIYNDGVVVSSASNSNVLDEFLSDLFAWIAGGDLGLTEVEQLKRGKLYESAVVAELRIDPEKVAPWSASARKMIANKWESGGRPAFEFEFEFGQIKFSVDPKDRSFAPVSVSLERRVGIPFEKNIYFSSAPLRTDDHLEVLEHLEKALS